MTMYFMSVSFAVVSLLSRTVYRQATLFEGAHHELRNLSEECGGNGRVKGTRERVCQIQRDQTGRGVFVCRIV